MGFLCACVILSTAFPGKSPALKDSSDTKNVKASWRGPVWVLRDERINGGFKINIPGEATRISD